MRMVDRLLDEQKKKGQKKQNDWKTQDPDEVEIMMEKPIMEPINAAASVFDRGVEKAQGGINTAPSVFERKALFHVTPREE